MAVNAINKNTRSNSAHHVGAAEQQLAEQDLAINKNGVAMQWTRHKKEVKIPKLSYFNANCLIIWFFV